MMNSGQFGTLFLYSIQKKKIASQCGCSQVRTEVGPLTLYRCNAKAAMIGTAPQVFQPKIVRNIVMRSWVRRRRVPQSLEMDDLEQEQSFVFL